MEGSPALIHSIHMADQHVNEIQIFIQVDVKNSVPEHTRFGFLARNFASYFPRLSTISYVFLIPITKLISLVYISGNTTSSGPRSKPSLGRNIFTRLMVLKIFTK